VVQLKGGAKILPCHVPCLHASSLYYRLQFAITHGAVWSMFVSTAKLAPTRHTCQSRWTSTRQTIQVNASHAYQGVYTPQHCKRFSAEWNFSAWTDLDANNLFIYGNEKRWLTPEEDLIMCRQCKLWAHEDCADMENQLGQFTCGVCRR
jgi:hypothetical protein